MSWFDEQIRERKKTDREILEESFGSMGYQKQEFDEDGELVSADDEDAHVANTLMADEYFDGDETEALLQEAVGQVLRYYHVKPKEVPENIRDMNEVLEYLLRPYGFMRRTVILSPGWYKDAAGAMLGRRKDDGSVVALLPFGLSGYRYYDHKLGKYVRISKKNEADFESEAFAFYKPFPL